MLKILAVNLLLFALLISGVEGFFILNKTRNFLAPRPLAKTIAVYLQNLPQGVQLHPTKDWPYPLSDDPRLAGKTMTDIDISQKYGVGFFDIFHKPTFNAVG